MQHSVLLVVVCLGAMPDSARAQDISATIGDDDDLGEIGGVDLEGDVARWLSDSTLHVALTALSAAPAYGSDGREAAEDALDTLAYTGVAVTLLKHSTRVPRPNDPSDLGSFPSGHTAAAFALAAALSDDRPGMAYPLYGWATAVGWSRTETGAHRWSEVLAGAALGVGVTKLLDSDHRPHLARRLSSSHTVGDVTINVGPQPRMGCVGLLTAEW